jgi:carbamoyltransferase
LKILGISAYYHDSAACLVENGQILAAAQEERFTRLKHDASFPENAIKFCLKANHLALSDIDIIVFYDKPFLKLERILETYYHEAPLGWWQFIHAMPSWLQEKLFFKSTIKKALKSIAQIDFKKCKLLFSEHHLSHAASAFYPSGFEEAAILTIDGVGEWATASICHGKGREITILKEMHFPDSLGLLYSSFTYFLGFKVNSGEYKLMGLAPYGNPESEQTKDFIEAIKSEIVSIGETGAIRLNKRYFAFTTSLKMIKTKKWEKLFGMAKKNEEDAITQDHCNLALAIQIVTEEIVFAMAKYAKEVTGVSNLCMAGGVALNCVANGKLQSAELFDNIFIQPAAGDAGGALGAALAIEHLYLQNERQVAVQKMSTAYFGPEFSNNSISRVIEREGLVATHFDDVELIDEVAHLLAEDKAVGWFQDKMEFGPRALGNRSILANPMSTEMQQKLNVKIKKRESFRPFAPIMLEDELANFFDQDTPSPFMLFVHPLKQSKRSSLPNDYYDMPLMDRLRVIRSEVPAITHVDFTARIQTVNRDQNLKITNLLTRFKELKGIGVLANTSFNVRGEPIVCNPLDALRCFMNTDMDILVMENFILEKENQPKDLFSKYQQQFKKD